MKGIVRYRSDVAAIPLGGGVERTVLAYDDRLMAAEVGFRYSVEDESVILNPGDSVVVPAGTPHGTRCLEKGVLLDVFTPKRDDFLAT